MPMSEPSVRDEQDQITEGRFGPIMVDTQINTGNDLLQDFMKKPVADMGVGTTPVHIGGKRPLMVSLQIQTEPLVEEFFQRDEPCVATVAHEPITSQVNEETGSSGSMCELPQMDLLLEEIVIPPTPEPSTIEVHDPYVDDWAESQLYSYAYKLNYDRMVKKKLIKETISKRPASS